MKLCITSTPTPIIESILLLTPAFCQYFCAIGKNSSELSIVVIEPFSGSPLAIHKVLRPVKRPISKHLFDWDILTIISKN